VKSFIKKWNEKTINDCKPNYAAQNDLKKTGFVSFFIYHFTERQPFARSASEDRFKKNVVDKKSEGEK